MTRHEPPPNPIAVAAWVGGTIAALAVILLYREPALFVWLVVVALVVWAMAATAAAFHLGSRLVDSDAERLSDADRITALEDVVATLNQENARLHGMQTERDLLAGEAVHVPLLRVVPTQRSGGHDALPIADVAVPVHTEVSDDELTALMRGLEEK